MNNKVKQEITTKQESEGMEDETNHQLKQRFLSPTTSFLIDDILVEKTDKQENDQHFPLSDPVDVTAKCTNFSSDSYDNNDFPSVRTDSADASGKYLLKAATSKTISETENNAAHFSTTLTQEYFKAAMNMILQSSPIQPTAADFAEEQRKSVSNLQYLASLTLPTASAPQLFSKNSNNNKTAFQINNTMSSNILSNANQIGTALLPGMQQPPALGFQTKNSFHEQLHNFSYMRNDQTSYSPTTLARYLLNTSRTCDLPLIYPPGHFPVQMLMHSTGKTKFLYMKFLIVLTGQSHTFSHTNFMTIFLLMFK